MIRTTEQKVIFKESLSRCIVDDKFLDRFYDIFMKTSKEAREKFKNTNLANQKFILKASLYIIEIVADSEAPVPALVELAKKHDRSHYDIEPDLYDIWLDCMIKAVAATDPQFDTLVDNAWRRSMGPGIEVMKSMY